MATSAADKDKAKDTTPAQAPATDETVKDGTTDGSGEARPLTPAEQTALEQQQARLPGDAKPEESSLTPDENPDTSDDGEIETFTDDRGVITERAPKSSRAE